MLTNLSPGFKNYHQHPQMLSLWARFALKHEASLRIMSNSVFTWAGYQTLALSWRARGFIQGFLPSDGLSTVGNESCLPAA
jgi:hypothetical protein